MYVFLLGEFGPALLASALFIFGLIISGVIAYRLNKSWKNRLK